MNYELHSERTSVEMAKLLKILVPSPTLLSECYYNAVDSYHSFGEQTLPPPSN